MPFCPVRMSPSVSSPGAGPRTCFATSAWSCGRDQIVVIRGRSGTGKSTLLQILAGLDRPTTGRVEIAGRSLEDLSAGELADLRRQTMGFIFQNFNLIPSWTAGQNVEAALIYTRLTRSAASSSGCRICSNGWDSAIASTTCRPSSAWASSNGWPLPGP